MHAMILAAGRGTRMQPLTQTIPKPLVLFKGEPLIIHQIKALKSAGITNIVINIMHLGEKIKNYLQDGAKWGVKIIYSQEEYLLDTGGGILKALPNLSNNFLVVSSDIYTNFDYKNLSLTANIATAKLIMVPNPEYNQLGDYAVVNNKLKFKTLTNSYTYANIGIFNKDFFNDISQQIFPLKKLIDKAVLQEQVLAEVYHGLWYNIGNLQQLESIK